MPKLPDGTVNTIASIATDEALRQIEHHVDAHPLRYGHDLPEEAFQAISDRLEFEFKRVIAELEVPPK